MVKYVIVFFITCAITLTGTFIGSVIGHNAGNRVLFVFAVAGGIMGMYVACYIITRLKNFKKTNFMSMFTGGIIGYITAAIIAVAFLHYFYIVILSISLAGAGALIGFRPHDIKNKN